MIRFRSIGAALLLLCIFALPAGTRAEAQDFAARERIRWTCVAPLANAGGDAADDYIGHHASNYLSAAFSGYPRVRILPRAELYRVMDDWGISFASLADENLRDAYDVGHLLDLDRIVVGSFVRGKLSLALSARVVDARTGATLSRAAVETAPDAPYADAYRRLLEALAAPLAEYSACDSSEAALAYLDEFWSPADEDHAKAQAALRAGDAASASAYLSASLSAARLPFPGLPDAADLYAALRPDSAEAKRGERNAALADQFERLFRYGATLRSFDSRLRAALTPDFVSVSTGAEQAVRLVGDQQSKKLELPPSVDISLTAAGREALASVFAGQEILALGPDRLGASALPEGPLAAVAALRDASSFTFGASVSYALRFLDGKGEVLYELVSSPVRFLSIGEDGVRYAASSSPSFTPTAAREGWIYDGEGRLDIRAEAAAGLSSLRYAVVPGSLRTETEFPFVSEARWRSFLLHAYRLRAEKPESGLLKDAVLADSFFPSPDPALGLVPLLPRNGALAGFARPTAVVYLNGRSSPPLKVSWSGALTGRASVPAIAADKGYVLAAAPEQAGLAYGPLSFSASAASPAESVSVSARLGNGLGWSRKETLNEFVVVGDRIVSDAGLAYSAADGRFVWDAGRKGFPLATENGLFLLGSDSFYRLDPDTGAVLSTLPSQLKGRVFSAAYDGASFYLISEFGGLEAVDAATGRRKWSARIGSERALSLDSGRVYAGTGAVYDAKVGALLFQTEGRGAARVSDGVVLWENGVCVDRSTGKRLWRLTRVSGTPNAADGLAFFGGALAARISDGSVVWKNDAGGSGGFLFRGSLYTWKNGRLRALEPKSGAELWSAPGGRIPRFSDLSLYDALDDGSLVRYDAALFDRLYAKAEYAARGILDATLADVGAASTLRQGVCLSNLARGGAAASAGLLPGDYLLTIDGTPVSSADHARDLFGLAERGTLKNLRIARQDAGNQWIESTLPVALGGIGDRALGGYLFPGAELGTIDRATLRERGLDHLARFDSFVVDSVYPGSAAAEAGLLPGDILLQADAVPLNASFLEENYRRLFSAFSAAAQKKTPVILYVIRGGSRIQVPDLRP